MTVRRAIRRRKPVPQPRSLPQNPFATRPSLLRNVSLALSALSCEMYVDVA